MNVIYGYWIWHKKSLTWYNIYISCCIFGIPIRGTLKASWMKWMHQGRCCCYCCRIFVLLQYLSRRRVGVFPVPPLGRNILPPRFYFFFFFFWPAFCAVWACSHLFLWHGRGPKPKRTELNWIQKPTRTDSLTLDQHMLQYPLAS